MSMTLLSSDGREIVPARKTATRGLTLVGCVVVLMLFGGIGTWAATAQLDSAAIAPGVVAVDSNWRTIQHLEGGIVEEIFVREGDVVERGQLLLQLDATRAQATQLIIGGQLDLAVATEARLIAERDGAAEVVFPADLLAREGNPELDMVLAGQRLLFGARQESLTGETEILRQRIEQLRDEIDGFSVQQDARLRQLELIEQELSGLRDLFEEGYVTRSRILALEREAERLRGERGEDLASIARTQAAIGEAELQILQLEKSMQEQIVAELRDVQAQIFDLEQRMIGATDLLDRIDIHAPTAGTILGLSVHTVGGVIAPGDDIMHIVPLDDSLTIKARVRPDDIENVFVGHSAEVRMSGLSQRTTPTLHGRVVTISADLLNDQASGDDYYEARVEIGADQMARLTDVELIPGMPAEVLILTGERTALDYLLDPIVGSVNRSFRE